MRHKPDTNSRCNTWIQSRCAYVEFKSSSRYSRLPETDSATPRLHVDRSVELSVKPPPDPGEMGSPTFSLIPLPHTSPVLAPNLVYHISSLWQHLRRTFCLSLQSFYNGRRSALFFTKMKPSCTLLPSPWLSFSSSSTSLSLWLSKTGGSLALVLSQPLKLAFQLWQTQRYNL